MNDSIKYIDSLLLEMPHSKLEDETKIDFKLEKPQWDKRMIYLVNRFRHDEELLNPFYQLSYGKVLKKQFLGLSDSEKSELLRVLPKQFIYDMELK